MLELLVSYAARVVGALALLFVAWIFAAWARRLTRKRLTQVDFDLTLTQFFANSVRYLLLILAGLSCLQLFGINVTSFAAVLAATGFAIGMAFQNSLSKLLGGNHVAGVPSL